MQLILNIKTLSEDLTADVSSESDYEDNNSGKDILVLGKKKYSDENSDLD